MNEEETETEYCPKCHTQRIKGTDYCVCGHKWDEPIDLFKKMFGIDLKPMHK